MPLLSLHCEPGGFLLRWRLTRCRLACLACLAACQRCDGRPGNDGLRLVDCRARAADAGADRQLAAPACAVLRARAVRCRQCVVRARADVSRAARSVPLTQGHYALLVAVFMTWGTAGFGMMTPQQSRLAALAPPQAPILLSLNSSMLYFGTALGAAIGGQSPASSALPASPGSACRSCWPASRRCGSTHESQGFSKQRDAPHPLECATSPDTSHLRCRHS